MKRVLFVAVFLTVFAVQSQARDYMVGFVSEYYREQAADTGFMKRVYHTLQVNSDLGSRLLILKGNDFEYRTWLREYLSSNKRLIAKVPDTDDDYFRIARAYEIDVTRIHPIDEQRWEPDEIGASPGPLFKGERHVLIVDSNEKRRGLIDLIVTDLGYPVTVSGSGTDALLMFRMQPDKFRMVIADSTLDGINGVQLVKNLIKTEPQLPVILGTGYGDKGTEDDALKQFTGSESVVVKPVVLRELSKTILSLLKEQA
ncbi:MAG: response regulator [Desulfobacteraceae bacterium]|nr:response regulator [Desulfobacteraceae bacterium]